MKINAAKRNDAMKEYFSKRELQLLRLAIMDAQTIGNKNQQLEYAELLKSFNE